MDVSGVRELGIEEESDEKEKEFKERRKNRRWFNEERERNTKKFREIAREEKETGDDKVRIGYNKIFLKQRWYWWDERENKLQEKTEEGIMPKKELRKRKAEKGNKEIKLCIWNIAGLVNKCEKVGLSGKNWYNRIDGNMDEKGMEENE